MAEKRKVALKVNGVRREGLAEPRKLLSDFLREDLRLVGTHVGCEHGVCGACTILLNGDAVRSCLMFAVQADGAELTTIEALSDGAQLHPIQEAFIEEHAIQCGFCTPGFVMSTYDLLQEKPNASDEEIREMLGGNLCRCTGYQTILEAVRRASREMSKPHAARTAAKEA
jgi:aerobic-type carbon monoxide dehydrogenase small subunit (CoxS/CutS family)